MTPTNPPAFPTLRDLYAWSTAQPEDRRSGATPCTCPLALYWQDQGSRVIVDQNSVESSDMGGRWRLPADLRRFVTEHDAAFERQAHWFEDDDTLAPYQVRRVIETLEREAMLTALEETLCAAGLAFGTCAG